MLNDYVLNILSIAFTALMIASALISVGLMLLLHKRSFMLRILSPQAFKWILWLIALAPWWTAFCVAMYFSVELWFDFSVVTFSAVAHWHHLGEFSWLSWHGVTLGLGVMILALVVAHYSLRLRKQQTSLNLLKDWAPLTLRIQGRDVAVIAIESELPLAFTAGWLRPQVCLSSTLMNKLTEAQLAVVVEHELHHKLSRDPLAKVVFSIVILAFWPSIRKQLSIQFAFILELMADAAAAQKYDHLDVADTLIKVARIQRSKVLPHNMVCAFGQTKIHERVQFLLKQPYQPGTLKWVVSALIVGTGLLVPLLGIMTIDYVHHTTELLFRH